MTTQAQIEANRRNAALSTGPRTEEGKERTRRNALKHGLSGRGIVLPDEEEKVVAKRLEDWTVTFDPSNDYEDWLTEQIVIESVRIDCGHRHENALRGLQVHRAQVCWDDDQRLSAEELAARLTKAPAVVSRLLRSTSHGCACLIERWEGLGRIVEARGTWTDVQRQLALDMLGTAPEMREGPSRLDPIGEKSQSEVYLNVAHTEISALQQLKDTVLTALDEHEQAAAALGVGSHVGPPLARLRRYKAACVRRLHWAVRQLEKSQGGSQRGYNPYLEDVENELPKLLANYDVPVPPPTTAQRDDEINQLLEAASKRDKQLLTVSATPADYLNGAKAPIDGTGAEVNGAIAKPTNPPNVAADAGKSVEQPAAQPGDSMKDWVRGQRPRLEREPAQAFEEAESGALAPLRLASLGGRELLALGYAQRCGDYGIPPNLGWG